MQIAGWAQEEMYAGREGKRMKLERIFHLKSGRIWWSLTWGVMNRDGHPPCFTKWLRIFPSHD